MQRRNFLRLAAALPLTALTGCGSGWNLGFGPIRGGGSNNSGGDNFSRVTLPVQVQLPAGSSFTLPEVALGTADSLTRVAPDGTLTVEGTSGMDQLATLYGPDSVPKLIGTIGEGLSEVSLRSTAEALVAYRLGSFLTLDAGTLLRELRKENALTELSDAIGRALAADPQALVQETPAFEPTLKAVTDRILATPSRSRSILVNPPDPDILLHGAEVLNSDSENTVIVRNPRVRRTAIAINRIEYIAAGDDSNTPIASFKKMTGPELGLPPTAANSVEAFELPVPTNPTSFVDAVSSWITAHTADRIGNDTAPFFTDSSPFTLRKDPAEAKRTKYKVFLLGAGILAGDIPNLTYNLTEYQRGFILGWSYQNLNVKTICLDLLAPFLLSLLGKQIDKSSNLNESLDNLLKSIAKTCVAVVKDQLPDIADRVAQGKLSPWDAFKEILKKQLLDTNTLPPAISGFTRTLITEVVTTLVAEFPKVFPPSSLDSILNGLSRKTTDKDGKEIIIRSGGISGALRILKVVDEFFEKASQIRFVVDLLRSNIAASWEVWTTDVKVLLDPVELIAPRGELLKTIKAVLDAPPPGKVYAYSWKCGKSKLSDGVQLLPFIASTSTNLVGYDATSIAAGTQDTIELKVYLKGLGANFEPIGSASAKVYVTELIVTPSTSKLKNSETVTLRAELKGMRPLKAGEILTYKWLTTRNAGELLGSADGGTTIPVEAPTATYLAHATKEGVDTVTVQVFLGATSLGSARASIEVSASNPYVIETFGVGR